LKKFVLSLLLFILFCPAVSMSAENLQPRLITVTGDAQIQVVPDEAVLTLSIESQDKILAEAKSKNDSSIKKMMAVVTKYKIDMKNVQTDFISVDPRYHDYSYERKDFIGYFVRKTIVITLKDYSKFDDFVTDLLDAGVNYIHNVEFRTSELRKYRDRARSLAIKAAQEKAVALSKELGQEIGKPNSITENHNNWSSYYRWRGYSSFGGYGNSNNMSQNVIQTADGGGGGSMAETTALPGQINVSASVTVSFEIK